MCGRRFYKKELKLGQFIVSLRCVEDDFTKGALVRPVIVSLRCVEGDFILFMPNVGVPTFIFENSRFQQKFAILFEQVLTFSEIRKPYGRKTYHINPC